MSRGSGAQRARAADAEARALAQSEFEEPLVLEAGAGTGKTTVLVGRIAGWALGPGWERAERELPAARRAGASAEEIAQRVLRGVVAITFTEAAAAEMAARVGELLRAVARGATPESFASRALPADPGEQARRAAALLGCLDALTVCTIHAWCHRILREHPIEAGVHPGFEVDANETRYERVVREVVEAKLAQALADPGDAEFVALAARVGPPDLEAALRVLVRDGVPPGALAADPFEPERIRAFCTELEGRLASLVELTGELRSARGERSRSTVRAVDASLALLREAACETRPGLVALVERLRPLWDEKDVERLGRWAKQELGKDEASAVGPRAPELARRADPLRRAIVHALRIDPELLELARGVLQPLLAEASGLLRARGIETYAALLRDARDLVVRRPEIAARIRRRIDQLLVDEFQDTDGIQCDLLAAIALEGPREERPVLFLVGDPKQSIYGWRNADLRAYERFVGAIERGTGARRRSLVVNFRSVPGILDEVERVVAPVMEPAPGLQPPFEPLLPCEARRELPGFRAEGFAAVEHWVTWTRDGSGAWQARPRAADAAQLEARALARNLLALRDHGVAWRDVALLFRSSGDFDTYLSALRDAAIPYVVERDRSYYRRREIIDAQAWLRCVVDPNDHLGLVAWLRSPAVGVPDAALLPLWLADLPRLAGTLHGEDAELLDAIRVVAERVAAEISGEIPGIDRVRGWEQSLLAGLRALARARAWLESEPPDVFAERARRLFAFEASEAARHLGVYRVANLDRWLRRLVASLEESGGNLAALLAELRGAVAEAREEEEGRPRDAAENAVHVLTIHKAKGLDFAHVYLLQHQKGAGRGRDEEKARVVARGDRFEYWLLRAGAATPGFEQAALDAKAVEEAERVRTLYVATTRARERLVVSGAWPDREARRKRGGQRERSHAQLLAARDPRPPDLEELAESLTPDRPAQEHGGARWFFPALVAGAGDEVAEPGRDAELPSAARVRRESEALLAARARARERALRPFAAVASARAGKGDDEADSARRYAEEPAPGEAPRPEAGSRERARAVGTAVHRALELLDPGLAPDAALRESSARAGEVLALLLGPGERAAALAAARETLERFVRGPLFARLREVAPHVVARELPVLLPPERREAGSLGFVSGAVDLVHRDPATGGLVVVDYKTDRVEKRSEIAERAAAYRAQGAEYQRALREGLGLDAAPRFELWFLHAGHREIVDA